MRRRRVRGKEVTPFLLDRFAAETEGESLRVNRRIILRNASLAARIAGSGPWSRIGWRNLTGGIVALHRATRA